MLPMSTQSVRQPELPLNLINTESTEYMDQVKKTLKKSSIEQISAAEFIDNPAKAGAAPTVFPQLAIPAGSTDPEATQQLLAALNAMSDDVTLSDVIKAVIKAFFVAVQGLLATDTEFAKALLADLSNVKNEAELMDTLDHYVDIALETKEEPDRENSILLLIGLLLILIDMASKSEIINGEMSGMLVKLYAESARGQAASLKLEGIIGAIGGILTAAGTLAVAALSVKWQFQGFGQDRQVNVLQKEYEQLGQDKMNLQEAKQKIAIQIQQNPQKMRYDMEIEKSPKADANEYRDIMRDYESTRSQISFKEDEISKSKRKLDLTDRQMHWSADRDQTRKDLTSQLSQQRRELKALNEEKVAYEDGLFRSKQWVKAKPEYQNVRDLMKQEKNLSKQINTKNNDLQIKKEEIDVTQADARAFQTKGQTGMYAMGTMQVIQNIAGSPQKDESAKQALLQADGSIVKEAGQQRDAAKSSAGSFKASLISSIESVGRTRADTLSNLRM